MACHWMSVAQNTSKYAISCHVSKLGKPHYLRLSPLWSIKQLVYKSRSHQVTIKSLNRIMCCTGTCTSARMLVWHTLLGKVLCLEHGNLWMSALVISLGESNKYLKKQCNIYIYSTNKFQSTRKSPSASPEITMPVVPTKSTPILIFALNSFSPMPLLSWRFEPLMLVNSKRLGVLLYSSQQLAKINSGSTSNIIV